jgi:IS30 family transposase
MLEIALKLEDVAMTKYTHLTQEERTLISHYHGSGISIRQISRTVGRSASTISRELSRNSNTADYNPETASRRYRARRIRPGLLEQNSTLRTYVIERLQEGISPEMIALRLKCFGHLEGIPCISHESIYQWLYKPPQKKQKLHKLLRLAHTNRGRRKRATRSTIQNRTSIHERPEWVNNRTEIGHWEVDLMAFLRNSQHLLVVHERVTRFTATIKLANKTAGETLNALVEFFQRLPKSIVRSITFDNGTEFARHMELAQLISAKTYFCDTYASWQKGGIENMNGRLRRDLPRSTNLKALTDSDIEQINLSHNLTPRKCLGGFSPIEALAKHMGKDIVFLFSRGVALQI